jgi:hypothetical protein
MKRRKFFIIIPLFFICSTVLLMKIQTVYDPPEKTLMEAFDNSGAKAVNSEISLRGRVDSNKYSSPNNLKRLVLDISKALGAIDAETACKSVENDDVSGIELDAAAGNNRSISISAMNSKQNGDTDIKESYITVSIVDYSERPELEKIRNEGLDILGRYGIKPKVNSCITGNYPGKFDDSRLNDICTNIFKVAEASKVEGIRDNNLISVSAFTPIIGESVRVNGKRVNMNFAVRYNSYENKTYIWLATPVITTEY